ncbi:hypothetical protein Nepgr_000581 [Nepenthes gracilis]|uniref:Uncharacterized protein n=1 Tax=Nepenthes gracilis TaxID=150966 RepID=A0AAD3RVJ3_NEPGR|nr:hypothetical protein Nepgr_000581 [Nepenthes gracilis]
MLHRLAVLRRQIQGIRRSPKVADETMFAAHDDDGAGHAAHHLHQETERRGRAWHVFSAVYGIIRIPFSIIPCFSHHHGNGDYVADGMWVAGGTVSSSEMEHHLMVTESMRYVILL